MFSTVKNFLISFAIAFASFGVVAFLVVAIVVNSIGGAFIVDPFGSAETEPEDDEVTLPPALNTKIEGNSLYILVVITDYRPSFYGDYDYSYLKNSIGVAGATPFPNDVSPSPDNVSGLPLPPEEGSEDTSFDGSPNIIGGLEENTYRTVHNDVTLLVRMDKENKQFTFTSFPSNTLVNYGNERLLMRDVFYRSGIEGVVNSVHSITGIRPDRYVLLHSEYVDDLVDEIEGIDTNLSVNMAQTSLKDGIDFSFNAGQQTLDGESVKQMLLYNGYTEDQNMNIEHFGMNMVRAFLSKLTQPGGYSTAGASFVKVQKYFITDMTVNDVVDNKDLWYGYSAFGKRQIDIIGNEVTENGELIFKVSEDATINAFLPYRKQY